MLNNVQVLRAVAAWIVICTHVALFNLPLLEMPLSFGHYGVDLFFVISGFVMVYTIKDRSLTPFQFILNRIIRIAPLYWVLTITLFTTAHFFPRLLKSTTSDPLDLLRSLLFIPYSKGSGEMQPVLFPGWTLNYEMFFYVLFAIVFLIRSRTVGILVVTTLLACLVALRALVTPLVGLADFYTSPLLLEFCFGMMIGLGYDQLARRPAPWSVSVALVIGAAAQIIAYPYWGTADWQAVGVGVPAAVIVCGVLMLEARGYRVRSHRLLLLGAASYALYLTHPFVLGIFQLIASRAGLLSGLALWPTLVLAVGAATIAGLLCHLWLERPLDRYLRATLARARPPAPISETAALWPWKK